MRARALRLVALLALGLAPGLSDLALMSLEPGAGLGVLPFPLLALGVEALEPLARLRVESVRVDVVALLVIGGRHAVQGRVEVLSGDLCGRAFVGLLERQADPTAIQVDVDDL